MHAVLASLAPFASLDSLRSVLLVCCCSLRSPPRLLLIHLARFAALLLALLHALLVSLAALPAPCLLFAHLASLLCSLRSLLLASLAAACFCPARFACLLLLPLALLASALLTFTSPPPRLLLAHLARLLCSLRSLLLASLTHCSLTARSLLAYCSRFARLTARLTESCPRFPCAMVALPARGGKLRCESPQSLSDPSYCTTLPFPVSLTSPG